MGEGTTPNNLPVQRSPFIGRDAETTAAYNLLLRNDVGLLTFTGPGGVGKTRLALHLARRIAAEQPQPFPHGIFFVNLAPITDTNLVVPTIAQTLGIKESQGQPIIEG